MKLNIACRYCESDHEIEVDDVKYTSWKNGDGFIQDIMPELSPSDRELLISETCNECWSIMFALCEEDENGEELY